MWRVSRRRAAAAVLGSAAWRQPTAAAARGEGPSTPSSTHSRRLPTRVAARGAEGQRGTGGAPRPRPRQLAAAALVRHRRRAAGHGGGPAQRVLLAPPAELPHQQERVADVLVGGAAVQRHLRATGEGGRAAVVGSSSGAGRAGGQCASSAECPQHRQQPRRPRARAPSTRLPPGARSVRRCSQTPSHPPAAPQWCLQGGGGGAMGGGIGGRHGTHSGARHPFMLDPC